MPPRSSPSLKLSFDLLPSGDGDDEIFFSDPARADPSGAGAAKKAGRRKRQNKNSRRKIMAAASADPEKEESRVEGLNGVAAASEDSVLESEVLSGFRGSCASGVELRQRAVNGCLNSGGGAGDGEKDGSVGPSSSSGNWRPEANGPARSETAGSLDWNRLMEETSNGW